MPRGIRDPNKPGGKPKGGKRPRPDINEIAFSVVQRSIGMAPPRPEDAQKLKEPEVVTMRKAGKKK